MHYLSHLLRYMLPIVPFVLYQDEELPIGYSRVITSRGGFVITSTAAFVIVKH